MAKEDGGPAFPMKVPTFSSGEAVMPGMSLRDHFAGEAVHSIAIDIIRWEQEKGNGPEEAAATISQVAYRIADAMIAERSK